MGQLDQAASDCKRALELNSDAETGTEILSLIYLMQGRPQDALPEIERVHIAPLRASLYAVAYYALRRKKQSDAALNELIAKYHVLEKIDGPDLALSFPTEKALSHVASNQPANDTTVIAAVSGK